MLDPVDFGEVVERFVGELGIGSTLKDGEEDPAGFLIVVLADREHSSKEVCAGGYRRVEILRECDKNFSSLIVDALCHVGFTDAETRLDGLGLLFVNIQNRGEFGSGDVELPCPLVVTGEQELDAGLVTHVDFF